MDLSHIARRDVFSAASALGAGITPTALARMRHAGEAHLLFRGWYSTRPWADSADWNRLAARAAYLHFDGRALVSHQSALIWAGLPVLYAPLGVVHLTRAGAGSSRSRPPLMIHRALAGVPGGDRVPLPHAIVQAGITGQPITALIAADAALHAGRITHDELLVTLGQLDGTAGLGPVAQILNEADERIESPGESIVGHRLRQLGWEVESQFAVETELGVRRADFASRARMSSSSSTV